MAGVYPVGERNPSALAWEFLRETSHPRQAPPAWPACEARNRAANRLRDCGTRNVYVVHRDAATATRVVSSHSCGWAKGPLAAGPTGAGEQGSSDHIPDEE